MKHLQTTKFEKEEKLKKQINKNEELLEELERINVNINQIREEKELTLQIKGEKDKEVEITQRQIHKILRMGERVFNNVKQAQTLTQQFNAEFKTKAYVKEFNSHDDPNNAESLLMETEQILY